MKNRIVKILGIVLAVAILVGLLIPAMPVSAGTLSWTGTTMPSTKGFQLVEAQDANLYSIAPDGKTIFAYAGGKLLKSADAGLTWSDKNIGEGLNGETVSIVFVPKDYATEKTIYAIVGDVIWRSRNGGASFSAWADGTDTGVGAINSIDVAEYFRYSGNIAILVAGATGIALYNDYDARWDLLTDTADGLVGTGFLAAAFSPNYKNDSEILAVTTDGIDTYLETMFGLPSNKVWNQRVNMAVFLAPGGDTTDDKITTATGAVFAFPSDYSYSSNNKVFVGLNGAAPLDVYRVNGSTSIKTTPTKATNLKLSDEDGDANIFSMAYKGTAASGTLAVSFADSNTIYVTKDVASSTPAWTSVDAPPTGVAATLAFAGDTLYAGTANDADGNGAVFASSTDNNLFTGLSLISFPDLTAVAIAKYLPTQNAPNQWVILANGTNQVLFKSTDAGKTWKEIYVYTKAGKQLNVNSVTFAGDKIVIPETGGGPPWLYNGSVTPPIPSFADADLAVLTSSNGGYTWDADSTTVDGAISAIAVAGPDLYVGSTTGGLYKNGSYDQVADLDGKVPWVMIPIPGFFMIYTLTGSDSLSGPPGPSDVYVSTDNGATFDLLGEDNTFNGLFAFAFNVPNKTIYAAGKASDTAGATIYQWKVGTSTAWEDIVTLDLPTGVTITGLSIAGDGTIYVSTKNAVDGAAQIYRAISFSEKTKAASFQAIEKTTSADFLGSINAGPLTVVSATGVNTLYPIIAVAAADSEFGIASDIKTFSDTLAAPVVTTAPVANAGVDQNFTAKWNAVDSPKSLTYEWQIATDDKFQGIVVKSGVDGTSATSAYIQDLVPGTQYYFRVRIMKPLFSAWSTTVPFVAKLASTVNNDLAGAMGTRIAPTAGATSVPLTPSFQWSAVQGAQSYKIQVADNPGFTSPIADATTTDAFYTMTTALQPNKTYYWRIQAIAGTNTSDWLSNVFTTAAPAAPPQPTGTQPAVTVAPPTVVVPTPVVNYTAPPAPATQAPGTPAYIWVIIAIGAVLVIAVIVLIARTRRV